MKLIINIVLINENIDKIYNCRYFKDLFLKLYLVIIYTLPIYIYFYDSNI